MGRTLRSRKLKIIMTIMVYYICIMQIRKELIMKKSKKMIGMLLLICVAMLLPVPANAASKSQTKKLLIAKKWSNKVDDPIMAYSSKYTFQFKKNGTVVLKGPEKDGAEQAENTQQRSNWQVRKNSKRNLKVLTRVM